MIYTSLKRSNTLLSLSVIDRKHFSNIKPEYLLPQQQQSGVWEYCK
jgi:prenyltransferase beta subunit